MPVPPPEPSALLRSARVAVVHDWLPVYGGAERVLEQILKCVPQADLYSLIDSLPPDQRTFLGGRTVHTSIVQRLPFGRKHYRNYFPIMPLAVEQFDLSSYDLIISSSYSFAKGVITGPHQLHLCYCHSPVRYAWDLQHQYLDQTGAGRGWKSVIIRALLHYIRMWDVRTANGVDAFAANSRYVSRRIRKVYQRASKVIYPPVFTEWFEPRESKEDFYITASRLVPYKRVDILIDAFARMPDRNLIIIGDGPEATNLRQRAPKNVRFVGHTSLDSLADLLQRARAFLFAAEEDFGIVTVEAQACGTPVIAFSRGGSAETVVEGESGVLFHEQTPAAVIDAIDRFEKLALSSTKIRKSAERFSVGQFRAEFMAWVENSYEEFRERDAAFAPVPAPPAAFPPVPPLRVGAEA